VTECYLPGRPHGITSRTERRKVYPLNIAKPCIISLSEHSGREIQGFGGLGESRETRTLLRGFATIEIPSSYRGRPCHK
jgi:hypothetical protein